MLARAGPRRKRASGYSIGRAAEAVNIPACEQRVAGPIADHQGRIGTRTFKFTVV